MCLYIILNVTRINVSICSVYNLQTTQKQVHHIDEYIFIYVAIDPNTYSDVEVA